LAIFLAIILHCPACSVIRNGCEGVPFLYKHMTKVNNLESKRDELHDRLKKGMTDGPFFGSLVQGWALYGFGRLYQMMDAHKILRSKE